MGVTGGYGAVEWGGHGGESGAGVMGWRGTKGAGGCGVMGGPYGVIGEHWGPGGYGEEQWGLWGGGWWRDPSPITLQRPLKTPAPILSPPPTSP